MPIHKDFHSMLDSMTKQYCTGESEETEKTESAEGYPHKTCRKALSVFYTTCNEKDLDYTKPMPKVKECISAILPFRVLEKIVDKPLRIRGIAMTPGMSRNFNIYTPKELQAFTQKLVSAPVYIEHVAVPNAVGKVIKTEWDEHDLWYEAEIYDDEVAAKIRKGLIQHVSVGADYETLDIVDGQVPRGLHNAELSLVAVPGIPETNVQVLEKLAPTGTSGIVQMPLKERGNMKKKRKVKEQNQGEPKTDKERFMDHFGIDEEAFQKLYDILGDELFKLLPERGQKTKEQNQQDGEIKPKEGEEYPDFMKRCVAAGNEMQQCATIWKESHPEQQSQSQATNQAQEQKLTEAEWDTQYINDLSDSAFAYIESGGEKDEEGKTKPRSLRHLPFKNAQGNIDHDHLVNALARLPQTTSDVAKTTAKKTLCAAVKQWNREHPDSQITSDVCGVEPSNQEQLLEAKVTELLARVDKLEKDKGQGNLAESLLKNSKEPTITVQEAIKILEGLLPSPVVERSSMGMQRECQEIRKAIFKLKEMLKSG